MKLNSFKNEITDRLGGNCADIVYNFFQSNPDMLESAGEIRIRAGLPLSVSCRNTNYYVSSSGLKASAEKAYRPTKYEINSIFTRICRNSLYAFKEDIKCGFVTLPGGHRVGIAGKILPDGAIYEVSSLNIRISREIKNCSLKILRHIIRNRYDVYNTLIISPPVCGKTTIIRDIARILGTGNEEPDFAGVNVGLIDERSEIAACYQGIPTNDVGLMTDVYDSCPKDKGILMMIRTMAPKIIITDEIGGSGDADVISCAMNAGVRIIATAHGYSFDDMQVRQEIKEMIRNGVFERYITLSNRHGPATIEEVRGGTT
ncbi:MAG: stage III sporulation protein AA [Clostridia bacterium]|nr:stage III sporulation protein AA [Clostridia bacterium]